MWIKDLSILFLLRWSIARFPRNYKHLWPLELEGDNHVSYRNIVNRSIPISSSFHSSYLEVTHSIIFLRVIDESLPVFSNVSSRIPISSSSVLIFGNKSGANWRSSLVAQVRNILTDIIIVKKLPNTVSLATATAMCRDFLN